MRYANLFPLLTIFIFQFDDLVEVFTDKLVAKIPSTHTGIVKTVNFSEDDICLVGHPLLTIETASPSSTEDPASEEGEDKEPEVPNFKQPKSFAEA